MVAQGGVDILAGSYRVEHEGRNDITNGRPAPKTYRRIGVLPASRPCQARLVPEWPDRRLDALTGVRRRKRSRHQVPQRQPHPADHGANRPFASYLATHGPQLFCRGCEIRQVIACCMTALADNLDPDHLPHPGDAHGDGVRRLRMCNRVSDQLGKQPPAQHRIGEHAQSRHLDVDDAPKEERLKPIQGSSNLFQKVDRRQPIRTLNAPSLAHVAGPTASSSLRATSFGAGSTNLSAQEGHR